MGDASRTVQVERPHHTQRQRQASSQAAELQKGARSLKLKLPLQERAAVRAQICAGLTADLEKHGRPTGVILAAPDNDVGSEYAAWCTRGTRSLRHHSPADSNSLQAGLLPERFQRG
jgi:hypothetical protein